MGRAIPRVQNQLRATDHPKGRTFALWCVSEYSNIPPFIRPTSAEMWCALMVSGDMENWARGDMRNWTTSIYEEVVELSGLRDRKSVGSGKRVYVRVDLGCARRMRQKKKT